MEPGEHFIEGATYRVALSKTGNWYADQITPTGRAVYVGQDVPGHGRKRPFKHWKPADGRLTGTKPLKPKKSIS